MTPEKDDAGVDVPARTLWLAFGGIVLAVLIVLFLFVPAWKGYGIYREARAAGVPGEYVGELQELADAKRAAELAAAKAEERATEAESLAAMRGNESEAARNELAAGREDLAKKEKMYKDLASSYSEELASAENELEACLDHNDEVIKDAARRICCIKRIDNPSVSGYAIAEDRIVCVESGGEPISC